MPKLSVILPTYNSAKFLGRIFESLQEQIEKDLEIIFINDGSIDNSLEILQKFAEQDSRIIVKDKENGGVSSARNLGMECATGEYITFLDPDDYIDKEMYSNMLKCAKTETDIVISGFVHEFGNKSAAVKMPQNMRSVYVGDEIYTDVLLKFIVYGKGFESLPQMGTVWRMLFKRDFIHKKNLKFLPFACQDDWCFALTALRRANCIAVEHGAYYHYVHYEGTITGKYNPKYPGDCKAALEKLKENGAFDFIPRRYENNPNLAFFFLIFIINRIVLQKKSLLAIKKEFLEILKWECFGICKIHVGKCLGKHKFALFLLKFRLILPLLLAYKLKEKFLNSKNA
jgi:glycosyltransferase involved in cell wall biosynthesis